MSKRCSCFCNTPSRPFHPNAALTTTMTSQYYSYRNMFSPQFYIKTVHCSTVAKKIRTKTYRITKRVLELLRFPTGIRWVSSFNNRPTKLINELRHIVQTVRYLAILYQYSILCSTPAPFRNLSHTKVIPYDDNNPNPWRLWVVSSFLNF